MACGGVAHKVTSPPQGLPKIGVYSALLHWVLSKQKLEHKSKCEKESFPKNSASCWFGVFFPISSIRQFNYRLRLKMMFYKSQWEVDIQLWPFELPKCCCIWVCRETILQEECINREARDLSQRSFKQSQHYRNPHHYPSSPYLVFGAAAPPTSNELSKWDKPLHISSLCHRAAGESGHVIPRW